MSVSASQLCVIVYYPDETADGRCINVNEGADGKEVLEKTGFDLLWTPDSMFGQMLCKINGIGTNVAGSVCHYDGEFWNFVLKDGDKWGHSPVGLNGGNECWNRDFSFSDWDKIVHYCAKDNDLIGFAFGAAGASPDMLKIKEVTIRVDGKKSSADKAGGTIKEVYPQSKIQVEVKLKNLYPKDTNIGIQNIKVQGVMEGINDGNDLDDESGDINLDAEEDDTATLNFNIPLEVKDDSYDFILTISGKDEKGIGYKKELKYNLKLQKEKYDLKFLKTEISPESVKCSGTVILDLSLANIGTKNEDVKLTVLNSDLGLNIEENFTLDKDPFGDGSKFRKQYELHVNNVKEGSYPIVIKADNGNKNIEETVNLAVTKCQSNTKEDVGITVVRKPTVATQEKPSVNKTPRLMNNYGSLILLSGILFVCLIVFIITAILIFRK